MDTINRTCSVCKVEKPLSEFYFDRGTPRKECKTCNCKSRKEWQKNNLDKVLLKNKKWRDNSEKYQKWKSIYAPQRRELCRKKYHENLSFKQKTIEYSKNYRHNPKNRDKIRKTANRLRKKYALNPLWRVINNLRRRLRYCLHGRGKKENTMKLVGCSPSELRAYIEHQFDPNMNWDNYGKWHIDHIVPCSAFDLSKLEEQKKCFHYSNLKPLWASDNLLKGGKILRVSGSASRGFDDVSMQDKKTNAQT